MEINLGFWKKVKEQSVAQKRAIMVLAPMANVTDAPFRRIIARYGKPDVMWTEFVSADGLCSPAGKTALLRDLEYSPAERPIVAQLFSSNPEKMRKAAQLVAELGFDGIDINMGCPDRTIEKQGAGAAMIKTPEIAVAIIQAAMDGARDGMKKGDTANNHGFPGREPIPVSVKTRIGYNKNEMETWIPALLSTGIAALTLHARTRKEMSKVPAQWEHVRRTVEIRDEVQKNFPMKTLILGNGDVVSVADGEAKVQAVGADGAMLGRAIFGNPWLFSRGGAHRGACADIPERLRVMVEHTEAFEELLGGFKNFAIMKKHYKAYVTGWDGAKELRLRLMDATTAKEVKEIVSEYVAK